MGWRGEDSELICVWGWRVDVCVWGGGVGGGDGWLMCVCGVGVGGNGWMMYWVEG